MLALSGYFTYCAIMTMTPTANKIDVYVPSINCFSCDEAADVVIPPVSAAADEVTCPLTPGVVPVVLVAVEPALLVLDVLTGLVAKPGDVSVLRSVCSTTGSGQKK